MTDQTNVFWALRPETVVGSASIVLRMRCYRGEPAIFVDWGRSVEDGNFQNIRYRLDLSPPVSDQWLMALNEEALFAPDARAFIARLTTAETFAAESTSRSGLTLRATFNLRGVSAAAASVLAACP